ncbi:MAG: polyprenyl synthetase family protein [Clostridiales bacterium]|nr:polyprenyl synthetase family protein [Clostridiales bacterium]
MNITEILKERAELVEAELLKYVSDTDPEFGVIFDAMRYSLLAGGKRLRPFLVLEFARLAAIENGGDADNAEKGALPYACAIEMIHTYSLIHDDLPCMDNDDLRRGMPTSHKKFGEANALLAGDALLTKAFETASSNLLVSDKTNCMAVNLLARCAGAIGMIGGQVLDLEGEKQKFGMDTLERLQSLKTGELIRCAALLGCYAGGASESLIVSAEKYALGLGRAFQVVDDILDVIGDEAVLGKPIGSDADSGKTTFATIMTIDEARDYAMRLTDMAIDAVGGCEGAETLIELAKYLLSRNK